MSNAKCPIPISTGKGGVGKTKMSTMKQAVVCQFNSVRLCLVKQRLVKAMLTVEHRLKDAIGVGTVYKESLMNVAGILSY